LWEAYLSRTTNARGTFTVKAHDVAALMMLLKISRLSWTPNKADHWLDIAGYAGCGWECTVLENAEGLED
jgi:hypothetical protein